MKLKLVVVTRLTSITPLKFWDFLSSAPIAVTFFRKKTCDKAIEAPRYRFWREIQVKPPFVYSTLFTVCIHFLDEHFKFFVLFLQYFHSICWIYFYIEEISTKNTWVITVPILLRKAEAYGIKLPQHHAGTSMKHL